MIIQLEAATTGNAEAARDSLAALAGSWGHDITQAPAETTAAGAARDDHDRVIDPVSLAVLIVSIPSAVLAVLDLADRIRKRRRAAELIDHARQLHAQHVTATMITRTATIEIRTLDPDQLLDLMASEDPPC